MKHRRKQRATGFTIIELMVVVAIIALLVAILLPSLSAARQHAKTVMCGSNLHHVGLAVANYLYANKAVYPASYVYPQDEFGRWSPEGQSNNIPFGYLHWSFFLYSDGQVGPEAFQCPNYDNGGAPATNPGPDPANWEQGQVDNQGQTGASDDALEDKQAPRLAYAANATIMPRNKFTTVLSGGQRVNRFVRENQVTNPGKTVLATEYLNNWKALGVPKGNGILSKAHRPINPFYHVASGYDEYKAPVRSPGFMYGLPDDQTFYGLQPLANVRTKANILDASSGLSQINAIGRHHPTNDTFYRDRFGGAANFLFADAHVSTMTVLQTMEGRMWGDRYYGLNGENEVINMSSYETD